ncbi:MAG: Rha family transcriptional regulator [Planktomarina sp.]
MAEPALAFETLVSPQMKTTSLCIARHFGKRHDNLLDRIDKLKIPDDYRDLNFKETFRNVPGPNGATRKERYYELTRDGFVLVVMGFTSAKAMDWRIKFLDAFNAMEAHLAKPGPSDPALDRMCQIMDGLSPAALDGLLRGLKRPTEADTRIDDLTTYLRVRLLDQTRDIAAWIETQHILKVIQGLRKEIL